MGHRCVTCDHRERHMIDADLASGVTYAEVARRFGLNQRAVARHARSHVSPALIPFKQEERKAGIQEAQRTALDRVATLAAEFEERLRREGISDHSYLQTADRLLKAVELLARLNGEMRPDTTVQVLNVMQDPQLLAVLAVLDQILTSDQRLEFADALASLEGGRQPLLHAGSPGRRSVALSAPQEGQTDG